jgi:hypothetical protein
MKTRILIILVTMLLFASVNAGTNNFKAISENDTLLVIVKKSLTNNYENQGNDLQSGKNIFAAVPDTSTDIIIIFRNIDQKNQHFIAENENSIDELNDWVKTYDKNRIVSVSKIFKG